MRAGTVTEHQRCMALGPFTTPQDLRRTRQVLVASLLRTRFRQEQVAQSSTWWVYLPPAANRAAALANARHLDARQILRDISLSFFPGAKIGVLGLNGSGKSSLLKIMAGIDTNIDGEARPQSGIRIGYLPQEPQLDPATDVRARARPCWRTTPMWRPRSWPSSA